MFRLLLADDHHVFLNLMKKYLEDNGYAVDTASSGEGAIRKVSEREGDYALVILDFAMGGGRDGAETAREMLRLHPNLYILIYSSDASRDALRESWKSGAIEFVDKSADYEVLLSAIRRWCVKYTDTRLTLLPTPESENSKAIASIDLVGVSNAMAKVANLVLKYRDKHSTTLIIGESGTGKEKVAKAIHGNSRLPFIAVNCAAYSGSAELIEAELFGVEKGSFTGAVVDKKGIFEVAGKGTVFLDEVHTLSLRAQQKLLRALQEKKVRPVGSAREYPVYFRLLAAAKPELEKMIKRGEFLPDLFFRLNVLRIEIPALRDRPEDVAPLVSHFLSVNTKNCEKPKEVLVRTLRYFEKYCWPGNVRELENTIESICATVSEMTIRPDDLDAKFFSEKEFTSVYRREPRDLSKEFVIAAVQSSRTVREAAERLGVPKSTLYDLTKRFGIQTGRGRGKTP